MTNDKMGILFQQLMEQALSAMVRSTTVLRFYMRVRQYMM